MSDQQKIKVEMSINRVNLESFKLRVRIDLQLLLLVSHFFAVSSSDPLSFTRNKYSKQRFLLCNI